MRRCLQKPERVLDLLELSQVTGRSEPPDVEAGNKAPFLAGDGGAHF